jgi:hypothetical protein
MAARLEMDHLVVVAETLAAGVEHVEKLLGVAMSPGGEHATMGTHNLLLSLGDTYLEVIATNPAAPSPGRPRWFDMDNFSGAPRLTNWVARTTDLPEALALAPAGSGDIKSLSRGDLRWSMAVPGDGRLPFDGAFPGLISWQGAAHPAQMLPDVGCRLTALRLRHPDAQGLRRALAVYGGALNPDIATGPVAIEAELQTPNGAVTLR